MNVYKTIACFIACFKSANLFYLMCPQYIFFFTNSWSSIAKIWPHTCRRRAVPGHNILMVTKFFVIPRLCSPMASLYLALIILTLSASFTVFFLSPLFYPWGATNILPHSSCCARQLKCFQLLVIILFTVFFSACIHLSWTQAIRTIYRGGFTSTVTLIVSYLSWKKD